MGKKIDQGPQKKECPSCGLGVALESTICEFCGWDFEEEDEWILQIEKLERELMLEKQKFEPGTVNHKIQSTLRNPVLERIESARSSSEELPSPAPPSPRPEIGRAEPTPPPQPVREARQTPPAPVPKPRVYEPPPAPPPRRTEEVTPAPAPAPASKQKMQEIFEELELESRPKVRRVRSVTPPTAAEAPREEGPLSPRTLKAPEPEQPSEPQKKTRMLRKVKG